MFDSLGARPTVQLTITSEDFENWTQEYSFDALSTGLGLGKLFCKHHNILDNLLYFVLDNTQSVKYIKKTYVK